MPSQLANVHHRVAAALLAVLACLAFAPSAHAAGAAPMSVPVLELRFFPTTDGLTLDPKETTYSFSLAAIRARVQALSPQVVSALERGSTYVKDTTHTPSLDYWICLLYTSPSPRD